MFAENNRISWSQMHCQCLLAALGMGLIWGIPEFTGREGAVGILIGGVLLVLWSGILRRQMTVFRDPIRYLGKVLAWLIAGIWESYLVLTGGWLVGKVGHLAGEYLVSGVPETLLPLFLFLRHLEDPIMYRHGGGWRKSHGGLQHGWEGSCCCWLQFKTVPLWRWCGAINIWKQQGLTGNGV